MKSQLDLKNYSTKYRKKMSIRNLIRPDDSACYDKILDCYSKHKKNPKLRQMCKNRSIYWLMEKLRKRNDRQIVQNALLLVLSLFEDHPPDLYSNRGKEIKSISNEKDKTDLLSELKKEFLS